MVGLTSALALLETGVRVTVLASRFAPDITSSVAAGLWFPYAVSGDGVATFATDTLRWYHLLYEDPASGVRPYRCRSIVPAGQGRPFWAVEHVGFEPTPVGFDAVLPVADSSIFLGWLTNRVLELGGSVKPLESDLTELSAVPGATIVNCTGIGARKLCSDEAVYPIKGTVVLVENPGVDFCLTDDADPALPTYLIPTSAGLVLGGTAESGNWDLAIESDQVDHIVSRCAEHEPSVADAPIIKVKTGLRPARNPIRVEKKSLPDGRTVIHNYGHGGSGFTLAWGTALAVRRLLAESTGHGKQDTGT